MDLQSDRKQFLRKAVAYSCSYDSALVLEVPNATFSPDGMSVTMRCSYKEAPDDTGPTAGHFFHVLDALSVRGLDQREHDAPIGAVQFAEESLLFRCDAPVAMVEGRLILRTESGRGRATHIDVKYQGMLRFRVTAVNVLDFDGAVEAATFLVPTFETSDTRFRWLTGRTCLAFGTCSLEKADPVTGFRRMTKNLDVYTTD